MSIGLSLKCQKRETHFELPSNYALTTAIVTYLPGDSSYQSNDNNLFLKVFFATVISSGVKLPSNFWYSKCSNLAMKENTSNRQKQTSNYILWLCFLILHILLIFNPG